MAVIDPLPVRLKVPGRDAVDSEGVWSVSYRVDGLLHLADEVIALEWAATRRTQHVALGGVRDEVDHSPVGTVEVPLEWITGVRLRRGWWGRRLQLWARRIDAFDGIPGARPGTITLRIHRRDRDHARAMAAAIDAAREDLAALPPP